MKFKPKQSKICETCKEVYFRHAKHVDYTWGVSRFCSAKCRVLGVYRRKIATKPRTSCGHCKKILTFENGYIKRDGSKKWYPDCRMCSLKKTFQWRKDNPDWVKLAQNRWRGRNPEKTKQWTLQYRYDLKIAALRSYSNNQMRCFCCGEDQLPFLTIDHERGDGAAHRKRLTYHKNDKYGRNYSDFYGWLKANHYPKNLGLRVLCMNCNWATRKNKVCPHSLPLIFQYV